MKTEKSECFIFKLKKRRKVLNISELSTLAAVKVKETRKVVSVARTESIDE